MRKKVTVVGAGNVGATAAQRLFERGYMDVVLVDVVEDMPQGKALDIAESGPVLGVDATIVGSNGYGESADSDVVVITAGIARKPGMSRDDLLFTNMKIMGAVTEEVAKQSPDAILIVVAGREIALRIGPGLHALMLPQHVDAILDDDAPLRTPAQRSPPPAHTM